jgi:hypothetical protein
VESTIPGQVVLDLVELIIMNQAIIKDGAPTVDTWRKFRVWK